MEYHTLMLLIQVNYPEVFWKDAYKQKKKKDFPGIKYFINNQVFSNPICDVQITSYLAQRMSLKD